VNMIRCRNTLVAAVVAAVGMVAASGCGDDDVDKAINEGQQQVENAGNEIDKAGGNLDEKAGNQIEKAKDEVGEGLKNTGKDLDEKNK
jgi:archaellin